MTIEKFDDLSKFLLQEKEGVVNVKIAWINKKFI